MSIDGTSSNLGQLVGQLASEDGLERMKARESLVEIGASAVSAVAEIADAKEGHVRWECAKTLSQIADPSSIDVLTRLLEDSEEGTRWDAALGLIAIGKRSVIPLLHAIIDRSVDYTILLGARHVMHEFSRTEWGTSLQPVYEELNSFHPRESAPGAAYKALQEWESRDST